MGLTKIRQKATKKAKPDLILDLAPALGLPPEEDGKIKFREPGSADLFIDQDRPVRLRRSYPTFPNNLLAHILMLASCYVPDKEDEKGKDLDIEFAELAREQRDAFRWIVSKFDEHFQSVSQFEQAVDDAGNASEQ